MNRTIFGIGLIVAGILIGCAIQLSNSKPEIESRPNPDRFVAAPFTAGGTTVYEFRNSQGGTCVLAIKGMRNSSPIALACMTQLPTLDYERLPPPAQ